MAMMALVTNLIANEVADEANLDKAFWVSMGLEGVLNGLLSGFSGFSGFEWIF